MYVIMRALDSQPPTSFWEPQCLLAPVNHRVQLEQRYVGRHCPPTIHQALFLAVHSNSIQQHSMNDHMMNSIQHDKLQLCTHMFCSYRN